MTDAQAMELLLSMQRKLAQGHHVALGIAPQSGSEEVRAAFLTLTKQFHPVKFARCEPATQRLANEVFLAVCAARDALSKPAPRGKDRADATPVPRNQVGAGTRNDITPVPRAEGKQAAVGTRNDIRPVPADTQNPTNVSGQWAASGHATKPGAGVGPSTTKSAPGPQVATKPVTVGSHQVTKTGPSPLPAAAATKPAPSASHQVTKTGPSPLAVARPAAPGVVGVPPRTDPSAGVAAQPASARVPVGVARPAVSAGPERSVPRTTLTPPLSSSPAAPAPAAVRFRGAPELSPPPATPPPSSARPVTPSPAATSSSSDEEAALYAQGKEQLRLRQWDVAIELFMQLVTRNPNETAYTAMLSFGRGRAAQARGDLANARAFYVRATQLEPSFAAAKQALAALDQAK